MLPSQKILLYVQEPKNAFRYWMLPMAWLNFFINLHFYEIVFIKIFSHKFECWNRKFSNIFIDFLGWQRGKFSIILIFNYVKFRGYKFLQRPLDEWATELLAMGNMLAQKDEKYANGPKPGVSFRRSFSSPRLAMVGRRPGRTTKGLEGFGLRAFSFFF